MEFRSTFAASQTAVHNKWADMLRLLDKATAMHNTGTLMQILAHQQPNVFVAKPRAAIAGRQSEANFHINSCISKKHSKNK